MNTPLYYVVERVTRYGSRYLTSEGHWTRDQSEAECWMQEEAEHRALELNETYASEAHWCTYHTAKAQQPTSTEVHSNDR